MWCAVGLSWPWRSGGLFMRHLAVGKGTETAICWSARYLVAMHIIGIDMRLISVSPEQLTPESCIGRLLRRKLQCCQNTFMRTPAKHLSAIRC